MSHLVFSSFMCSINWPSVDILIPRYLHLSVLCILPAFTVSFISSPPLHFLTIIYFVFFRPKLIFFSFSILAQDIYLTIFYYIICITILSIFYFFSNAVNCGCFRTAHDGSKYYALFYHFDLYIFYFSYWCFNYYICFFVHFI